MWYYTLNDQQAGPASQADLAQMLQSTLPADTLVWKEGMADWVTASTLGEFHPLTNTHPITPPPISNAVTIPTATSNPYIAPVASFQQNYQAGEYPLPKVKKANFGLLLALMLIGSLTMVGGYGAMMVSLFQTSSDRAEQAQQDIEVLEDEREREQVEVNDPDISPLDEDSELVSPDETHNEADVIYDNEEISEIETLSNPLSNQFMIYSSIGFLGIVIMALGGILGLVYVHRAWQLLRPTQTSITPGQAVGFMFIPLFNLYWLFIAYHKWAVEWNNTCRRHPSLTYAPKGSEGVFLAMAICYCATIILSFLGLFSSAVLYVIGMKSMCDAINFAAENGEG